MKLTLVTLASVLSFGLLGVANANSEQRLDCENMTACYEQHVANTDMPAISNYANYAVNKAYNKRYKKFIRARFPSKIQGKGYKFFVFSPRMRQWAAYDAKGYRVKWGFANGGSGYCADLGRSCRSPGGTYRIQSKGSPSCKSRKFPIGRGGAPMPYCMFFRGGYAIHGSPYISNNNGSHGCIRVTTTAAKWLSENFLNIGTIVKVLSY